MQSNSNQVKGAAALVSASQNSYSLPFVVADPKVIDFEHDLEDLSPAELQAIINVQHKRNQKVKKGVKFVKDHPLETLDLAYDVVSLSLLAPEAKIGKDILKFSVKAGINKIFKKAATEGVKGATKFSMSSEGKTGEVLIYERSHTGEWVLAQQTRPAKTNNVNNLVIDNAIHNSLLLPKPSEVKLLPAPITPQKQPTQSVVFKSSNNPGDLAVSNKTQAIPKQKIEYPNFDYRDPDTYPVGVHRASDVGVNIKHNEQMWTKGKEENVMANIRKHYNDHKTTFKNSDGSLKFNSVKEYYYEAKNWPNNLPNPEQTLVYTKQAAGYSKGEIVFYDYKTNTTAVYTADGVRKTHFEVTGKNSIKNYLKNVVGKDQYAYQQELLQSSNNHSVDVEIKAINKSNGGNKDDESDNTVEDRNNKDDKTDKVKLPSLKNDSAYLMSSDLSCQEIISANNKADSANLVKTVQALMLIIDFITPEWIKTLILSLQPIKNMQKHFKLSSNDADEFVMGFKEVKEINYQKIEIDKENAISRKIKNEFDENLEKSTISQSAQVSYDQIIGKNKPSESIVITKEELLEIFFITLCTDINSNINRENTNQQVILDNEILFNQLNNNYACSYEDRSLDYNSNLCNNEVSLLSEESRSIEIY